MESTTRDILDLFFSLCSIPRPSGGEQAAAGWITQRLEAAGLRPESDAAHNVRCFLPASAGRDSAPGVVLQAHTDMVCAAAPGAHWRPGRDPVTPVLDGDWLRSDGRSSLGADNGIGAALMLWLALHPELPHGPVLLLFTAGEEQGLTGAKALDPRWLAGYRYYINLDAFRGDAVIYASAGGLRQSWNRAIGWEKCDKPFAFTVALSGLTGGHSGFDIHRGRQNAILLLLDLLRGCSGLRLCALAGGSGYNAIPTDATAVAAVADPEALRRHVRGWEALALERCHSTDPGLKVALTPCSVPAQCWDRSTAREVTLFAAHLPAGPQGMRDDCPGTVADSGNPAVVETKENQVTVRHFARCATRASLERMRENTAASASSFHFTPVEASWYSPWEGRADSRLVRLTQALCRDSAGTAPEALALHVGLESSVLLEQAPHLSGISLGCDILDAHSVSERVRLSSIPRLAQLVTGLIDKLSKEDIQL